LASSASEWRERFLDDTEGLAAFHSNNHQTKRNPGQTKRKRDQTRSCSSGYFSQQYEPLKWRTNMELNKGVEIKEFPKTTIAYVSKYFTVSSLGGFRYIYWETYNP
jgi:hypothetical protein